MTRPLYVFDLDETLIHADSSVLWNQFIVEKGLVTSPDFLEEDKRLMDQYASGDQDLNEYLSFAIAPLLSIPVEKIAELVDECVESKILSTVYPQARTLIETLRAQGKEMLIISASSSFIVEGVGKRLGIPVALGVDLEKSNGCYTSKVRGVPSYKEGKVTRLKSWIAAQNKTFDSIHFFTDSINDLPSCLNADFVYLVNPCPKLREYAKDTQWEILNWSLDD
ncbi:HAD family hydrolase [Veronia pacifica]|uniref:HAD family hydrolase n=1 Tax=Veronia pacifica TaxID=1080227 RepID=A0A1C3EG53_9GAMM|nr:HAD family hydrolase [Veronia pacifica]ODA32227.1 HAD family hydrolase [Veronia pacifica]